MHAKLQIRSKREAARRHVPGQHLSFLPGSGCLPAPRAGTAAIPARPGAGTRRLQIWSIGCASGEEPYTLALIEAFTKTVSRCKLEIVATDADSHLSSRASRGCYLLSSLRELPRAWQVAFEAQGDELCLKSKYQAPVRFVEQDIRERSVDGPFDLILCRNLVFTYLVPAVQVEIAP